MNCADGLEELSKVLKVLGKRAYEYLDGEANIHHHLALLQECGGEEIEFIKNTVCKCAVEGDVYTPETIGTHLQNDYLMVMNIFSFYISANYKEFFTEGLQELKLKKEAESQKPVKTDEA